MKEYIKYNDRKFILTAYKVKTERDLLLTASSDDTTYSKDLNDLNLDIYLRILEPYIDSNINIYNLYPEEKLFLLYRLRATSVSDQLSLNTRCDCGCSFKSNIDLGKIAELHNIDTIKYPDLKDVYSPDLSDIYKDSYLESNIMDCDSELDAYLEANTTKFNFIKTVKCYTCKKEIEIDLTNPEIYKNIFSENPIGEFYKSLTRLSFLGKFTIDGILNDLYPFEREIFISLINAEVEEQNKALKKNHNV